MRACVQRVMSYIRSGKEEGATLHEGGERFGTIDDLVEVPDSGGPYVVEDILA